MNHLKIIISSLLLVVMSLSFTACSGGEADYTLDDVLNLNLVTGSAEFDIPNRYVIEEHTSVVTTITVISRNKYSFTIAGGEDKARFMIDPNSGQLSFAQPPSYHVDGDNAYEVVVGVVLDAELSTFTIVIEVVQDITQVVPLVDYVIEKLDAVIATGPITEVRARPADENGFLEFTLDAESNSTFQIDKNGQISLREPLPDFATLPHNDFELSVTVTDGYGNSLVVGPIVITLVENRDLIRPVVETQEIFVIENSLGATQIETKSPGTGVIDKYLLDGTDKAYFTLSSSGVLAFKEANDYETLPNSFTVTVQVGDDKGNLSEVQTITVTVSDLDEQFTFQGIIDFTPMEGTQYVGVVTATPNVIESLPAEYSLLQGGELLEIDASGTITFKTSAQKGQAIAVQVLAQSGLKGSETTSALFYVNVQDDPDKIEPVFNSYSRAVTLSTAVNEAVAVATVSATPQGSATSITYQVIGVDSTMLYADTTGRLFFTNGSGNYARQDANHDNVYEVAVIATDDNGNSITSDTVKITLIIDETIVFNPVADASVGEGDDITNTLVATSTAGYQITYSVQSGYDYEIEVTVDPYSGAMTVHGVKYHSFFGGTNYHDFTVKAQDPYGNISTQEITIQVTR